MPGEQSVQLTGQQRVARAAVLVTLLFALSRILGLARTVVFGFYFGTGPEMDAYNYAARISELLFNVVAGGALGSAFIPIFTGRLTREDRRGAWQLAAALINWVLALLAALSLLAALGAPWLMRTVIAPQAEPAIQARAVLLLRVMLLTPAIFGVSGIVMGALNGCQHFLLPALAPIFYNLALIGGAVWGGQTGNGTFGAAVGTVVGALLHLGVQVPGLIQQRARYTLTLGLADPEVRAVGRLLLPRVFGVAAVQFNFVITNNLASGLGAGVVSVLAYAWMLVLLPNVMAQAIGTTVFPTFSAQAARRELGALRETLSAALRTVIALLLPAAVGLMVLGRPVVALAFERGAFSAGSTTDVAWALALFSVGLIGHATIEVLARAFYALHDTWTPALAAAGAVVINVALGLTLPLLFSALHLPPHGGLALANGLAALAEMTALLVLIGPRLGGLDGRQLRSVTFRVGGAALGMAALVVGWLQVAPAKALWQSLGGLVVGGVGYVALGMVLRIEELPGALRLFLRRRAENVAD